MSQVLKGKLSYIGAIFTAFVAAWPSVQDGIQSGEGTKTGLIAGLLTLALGIIRKLETIEKK